MEPETKRTDLLSHFQELEDPRREQCLKHALSDILVIAVCAVICGADSWAEMEAFGLERQDWLKTFLKLENGIPSHDTFGRVFSLINPKQFQDCFLRWTRSLTQQLPGEIISLDGKTSRRSHQRKSGKKPLHLVSAWAQKNHMILAQVQTEEQSNEITALPELLALLDVRGCIVTIDAIGTQTEIAKQIIDSQGDYVLALKANQASLHQDVQLFLDALVQDNPSSLNFHQTVEKNHGRMEQRCYWITDQIGWLTQSTQWRALKSLGMVESSRTIDSHTSVERRYYITSLKPEAKLFASAVRGHWQIENKVHWLLDVVFKDDLCRARQGHAAANFALLRRLALNVLRQDQTYKKRSIKTKRFTAALNLGYLKSLIIKI